MALRGLRWLVPEQWYPSPGIAILSPRPGRPRSPSFHQRSRPAETITVSVTRVQRANRAEPANRPSDANARAIAAVETPALLIDEATIVRVLEAAAGLR